MTNGRKDDLVIKIFDWVFFAVLVILTGFWAGQIAVSFQYTDSDVQAAHHSSVDCTDKAVEPPLSRMKGLQQ